LSRVNTTAIVQHIKEYLICFRHSSFASEDNEEEYNEENNQRPRYYELELRLPKQDFDDVGNIPLSYDFDD
jgi:hypothetical protein